MLENRITFWKKIPSWNLTTGLATVLPMRLKTFRAIGKHWNGNVFILMKFSSLAALKVVKMTTSSAASDENFVKMTTFSFQWSLMKVSLQTSIRRDDHIRIIPIPWFLRHECCVTVACFLLSRYPCWQPSNSPSLPSLSLCHNLSAIQRCRNKLATMSRLSAVACVALVKQQRWCHAGE